MPRDMFSQQVGPVTSAPSGIAEALLASARARQMAVESAGKGAGMLGGALGGAIKGSKGGDTSAFGGKDTIFKGMLEGAAGSADEQFAAQAKEVKALRTLFEQYGTATGNANAKDQAQSMSLDQLRGALEAMALKRATDREQQQRKYMDYIMGAPKRARAESQAMANALTSANFQNPGPVTPEQFLQALTEGGNAGKVNPGTLAQMILAQGQSQTAEQPFIPQGGMIDVGGWKVPYGQQSQRSAQFFPELATGAGGEVNPRFSRTSGLDKERRAWMQKRMEALTKEMDSTQALTDPGYKKQLEEERQRIETILEQEYSGTETEAKRDMDPMGLFK